MLPPGTRTLLTERMRSSASSWPTYGPCRMPWMWPVLGTLKCSIELWLIELFRMPRLGGSGPTERTNFTVVLPACPGTPPRSIVWLARGAAPAIVPERARRWPNHEL